MTHIHHQRLDRLIKHNKTYRYEQELAVSINTDRKNRLMELMMDEKKHKNTVEIRNEKMQDHIELLRGVQFKVKWNYLRDELKINRLTEYFTRNKINDEKLLQTIIGLSDEKKIKSRDIVYNSRGYIDDIIFLKKNDTMQYYINIKESKKVVKKNVS